MKFVINFILLCLLIYPANAQIHKWQSEDGSWHITNSVSESATNISAIKEKVPKRTTKITSSRIYPPKYFTDETFKSSLKNEQPRLDLWKYWETKITPFKLELINARKDLIQAEHHLQKIKDSAQGSTVYYNVSLFRNKRWTSGVVNPVRDKNKYSDVEIIAIRNSEQDIQKKEAIYNDKKSTWQSLGSKLKETNIPYRLWMDNFMNDSFIKKIESY